MLVFGGKRDFEEGKDGIKFRDVVLKGPGLRGWLVSWREGIVNYVYAKERACAFESVPEGACLSGTNGTVSAAQARIR